MKHYDVIWIGTGKQLAPSSHGCLLPGKQLPLSKFWSMPTPKNALAQPFEAWAVMRYTWFFPC
jgi:hypothetical protein